eukprot:458385_1
MRMISAFCCLLFVFHLNKCQDPADEWLAYAKLTNPANDGSVITFIEAYWTNLNSDPEPVGCYYSPWFGIETSDNLNLIQPVNPWDGLSQWSIYNEYFQWEPIDNYNSKSGKTRPGDLIYGSVTFNENKQSYHMIHTDLTNRFTVESDIAVQKDPKTNNYKKYTIGYFVFEKTCTFCTEYPPNNIIIFHNITVYYGGKKIAKPKIITAVVDEICEFKAHVIDDSTISITWNSTHYINPI